MKAIGASDRQIRLMFLAEAAILSVAGGVIGLAVGLGGGWLLGTVVPALRIEVPVWIIPVSLGAALGVGLAAGIVPAAKAARLDPIDALRTE